MMTGRFSGSGRVFQLCLVLVSLSACAPGRALFDEPQLVASPDTVSLMLAEAADRAATATETLAAIEYARTPAVSVGPIENAPPELRRAITINWVGPVDPLAKQLADRAGYGFMSLGARPPVPVIVSIDVENRPIVDVLRDMGLQLGKRADVRLDARRKMVEIHYAPHTGAGG